MHSEFKTKGKAMDEIGYSMEILEIKWLYLKNIYHKLVNLCTVFL